VAMLAPDRPVAAAHHERLDGEGLSYGLAATRSASSPQSSQSPNVFGRAHCRTPLSRAMPIAKANVILAMTPARFESGLRHCGAEIRSRQLQHSQAA